MRVSKEPEQALAGRSHVVGPCGRDESRWADLPNNPVTRLSSAEQTIRDISHAMAHDVRTSLRHVVSYAQLLGEASRGEAVEPVHRLSLKVIQASQRLEQLLDAVSGLARLQSADLRPTWVDTVQVVHAVVQELDERDPGRRCSWLLASDLPPVLADAQLLRQAWHALLDNAWQGARQSGHPRVEVVHELREEGVAFLVKDNGPGFDTQRIADAFVPFQLSSSAHDSGPGASLAMVRRIVGCHGGRVWAHAVPGEGATFAFSLPTSVR